jgi:DNA polymerase-3 subunit delta'
MNEEMSPELHPLWETLLSFEQQKRRPQAILFLNATGNTRHAFIERMLARLLCQATTAPCGHCQQCRLLHLNAHPDVYFLSPADQAIQSVKVDAVRGLEEMLYLSPQIASLRIICLGYLEKYTVAATNALLKTIEEPPAKVLFIGLTQQIDRILPTMLSRFQQWRFPILDHPAAGYLDVERWRECSSTYVGLISQSPQLAADLDHYLQGKTSVTALAQQWSGHDPKELLKVLYCVFAEMIRSRYSQHEGRGHFPEITHWQCLMVLQAIEAMISQLQDAPSLNPLLLIEAWLIDVAQICSKQEMI